MEYEYPKEIQIGGHTYRIELVEGYHTSDTANYVADSAQGDCLIRVAVQTTTGEPVSTSTLNLRLLHELIEQINVVYVVELGEDSEKENKVERLAQGLLQVLEQLGIHLIKEN